MDKPVPMKTAALALCLACAWPLVNFYLHNAAFLTDGSGAARVLFSVLAGATLPAIALVFGLRKIFGEGQTARFAVALALLLLILFSFKPVLAISDSVFEFINLPLAPHYGYALVFLLVPLVALAFGNSAKAVQVLLTVLGVGLAGALLQLGLELSRGSVGAERSAASPSAAAEIRAAAASGTARRSVANAPSASDLPNIYHLVVDEYARADQLEKVLGFDNSSFTDALRARGFRVLGRARSNYPYTLFSLTSMFAMDYPYDEDTGFERIEFNGSVVGSINPAVERLLASGYRYGHIGTNLLGGTQCADDPDVTCLTPRRSVISTQDLEILEGVLRMTPISYFASIRSKTGSVTNVEDVREIVQNHPLESPFLLFAHTLAPHSPYTTRADCSDQPVLQFSLDGGLDPAKYLQSLQCVNKRILGLVETLAEADPDSIVILHSDHGSQFQMEETWALDAWTRDQFDERYSVLAAVKAPERCLATLPEDLTLVNLYPFVAACVERREPEYLEDRFYNVAYQHRKNHGPKRVVRFPEGGPVD